MTGVPASAERRRAALLARSVADGTCRIYTGVIQSNGYGQFHLNGRREYAHRASYILFVGPIPDGLHIDHTCRNRACIEPSHLEAVTQEVNNQRAAAANQRDHCRRGHPLEDAYRRSNGRPTCRTCALERSRRYNVRRAAL